MVRLKHLVLIVRPRVKAPGRQIALPHTGLCGCEACPLTFRLQAFCASIFGTQAGDIVIEANTPAKEVYYIRSGELEVVKDGKRMSLLHKGGFCGDIFGGLTVLEVRAFTDCALSYLESTDVEEILQQHPEYEHELRDNQMWVSARDMTDEGDVSYSDWKWECSEREEEGDVDGGHAGQESSPRCMYQVGVKSRGAVTMSRGL